jgi:hypothetical protein
MIASKDDFAQMDLWDAEEDAFVDEVKKEYKLEKIDWSEEEKEFPTARVDYLKVWITMLDAQVTRYYTNVADNVARDIPFKQREILELLWEAPNKLEQKINKLQTELYWIENKKDIEEGKITGDMIGRAKQYPFENLMQFDSRGKAKCPFHDEKTASFSLDKKRNRARCFGCSHSVDPIAFVMETQNKNFVEAVKKLQ